MGGVSHCGHKSRTSLLFPGGPAEVTLPCPTPSPPPLRSDRRGLHIPSRVSEPPGPRPQGEPGEDPRGQQPPQAEGNGGLWRGEGAMAGWGSPRGLKFPLAPPLPGRAEQQVSQRPFGERGAQRHGRGRSGGGHPGQRGVLRALPVSPARPSSSSSSSSPRNDPAFPPACNTIFKRNEINHHNQSSFKQPNKNKTNHHLNQNKPTSTQPPRYFLSCAFQACQRREKKQTSVPRLLKTHPG